MSKSSYTINPDDSVTTVYEFEHDGKKKCSTTVTRNIPETVVITVFDKDGTAKQIMSEVTHCVIISHEIVDI